MDTFLCKMTLHLLLFVAAFLTQSSATSPADFKAFLEGEPYISYNLKIFPRVNQNDNVTVDVKMYLIAITDFNEVANQMEVVGYIKVKWLNELLQWTTSEHPNVENIILSQNNLWRPSIVLSNSVDSLFEIGHKSYQIRIDRDGNCEWVIGVVSKTSCAVDISYYPFDKQKCEIIFNPWGFNDNQISLYSTESEIDLTHYMENVEWDIGSTEVTAKSFSSSSYLHFTINLERKPIYFLVNMVIPILILGLLNGLVFLLPSDSGERVSYAITAFLTFAVFLTMVSENLPKASEPMSLLCYFLTLMLVMSALSTIITIMTLRVYHQDEDSDVPKWLRHVIQFVKCRKCKKWCGKKPEPNKNKNNMVSDTNDSLPKKKMFDDDSDSDSDSDFDPLAVEVDDTKGVTWKEVGRTLDILFFFLFMIGTVVITIFFLVPLASAS